MKDDRAQVPLDGAEDIVFRDRPNTPRSGAGGATAEAACGSRSGQACAALRQTKPIPAEEASALIISTARVRRLDSL